jgi:hypothetical protein
MGAGAWAMQHGPSGDGEGGRGKGQRARGKGQGWDEVSWPGKQDVIGGKAACRRGGSGGSGEAASGE